MIMYQERHYLGVYFVCRYIMYASGEVGCGSASAKRSNFGTYGFWKPHPGTKRSNKLKNDTNRLLLVYPPPSVRTTVVACISSKLAQGGKI